jgi:hypothetical protein
MAQPVESERIDTLLALGIAFGQSVLEGDDDAEDANARTRTGLYDALNGDARKSLQRRAHWYAKLAPDEQTHWLARTLVRPRTGITQLDEHVHPSHVLEALRDEPPRVRALILRYLPPSLARACAAALDGHQTLPGETRGERRATRGDASHVAGHAGAAPEAQANRAVSWQGAEPLPELVALVRRVFLSHFVSPGSLRNPSPLESLTGVELARCVRLLGVRETAVACRGIERAEAVGSFLRRFSSENARAIAAHMATLVNLEPARVALAEGLVHEALEREPEPEAMLDRLGMRVLAAALAARESPSQRAACVAQKLPVEAARALRRMVADCCVNDERKVLRLIGREAESVALSLRRFKAGGTTESAAATMAGEAFESGT